MEKMLKILIKHQANFSVEFFVKGAKVRVRKSGAWSDHAVWESAVFKELKDNGYGHSNVRFVSGSTPTAVVEYFFQK